jgi:hypothetical protein
MADVRNEIFGGSTASIVFQSSGAMNGKLPDVNTLQLSNGKAIYPAVATDTGGVYLKDAIILQSVIVHAGSSITMFIEKLDGTADLSLGLTLAAGFNKVSDFAIPGGTILKVKSGGAAIVELVGKNARTSFPT